MPGKLPLSVLLLARDETRRLEALLPTLAAAREVVMVWDAQGAPQTRATAERLGARVFTRELAGFGAQRQYALEQCREPWVLWLDADEWLDSAAWAALERAVAGVPRESGFTLTRRSWFLGRRIRFCGWQGERILRVFRRERAGFDDAAVHERVQVEGAIGRLEGTIEHHSYETWEDCARKLRAYAHAGALPGSRGARRAGLLDVVFRPPLRFLRMYVLQVGFLDGAHGLVLCALAATQVFLKYAERWASRGGRGRAEGRA